MAKDTVEALQEARCSRRGLLKGLLVGLGAGVVVQAAGGVTAFARGEQEKGTDGNRATKKTENTKKEPVKLKAKGEEPKKDLSIKKEGSKTKNEKKKTEEPKAQKTPPKKKAERPVGS